MKKLNLLAAASGIMIVALALAPAPVQAGPVSAAVDSSRTAAKLQYAGALTFSPDGVLFVGDNISGAVFAYPMSEGAAPTKAAALDIEGIDDRIATLLKTPKSSVHINSMAVHPISHDVYLSVSFGTGSPALVKVSPAGSTAGASAPIDLLLEAAWKTSVETWSVKRSTTKLVHQTRPARLWPSLSRLSVIGSDFMTEIPIRISPEAKVLPANTLRFYIHFPRPGEAHFDRDQLWLLDDKEHVVRDPFLVLSQELWSPDGRRLTVLMEPGRIKRGLGADPTHDPALVVGRTYNLVITALGQTARHTFRVSDPVLEAVDETHWRLVSPAVGSLDPAVVHFDRVMDAALCEDEIGVLTPSGEVVQTLVSLAPGGTAAQIIPSHPWSAGEHRLVVSERLEDVCGNRLGEALDHDLSAGGRPRAGMINFIPRSAK